MRILSAVYTAPKIPVSFNTAPYPGSCERITLTHHLYPIWQHHLIDRWALLRFCCSTIVGKISFAPPWETYPPYQLASRRQWWIHFFARVYTFVLVLELHLVWLPPFLLLSFLSIISKHSLNPKNHHDFHLYLYPLFYFGSSYLTAIISRSCLFCLTGLPLGMVPMSTITFIYPRQ